MLEKGKTANNWLSKSTQKLYKIDNNYKSYKKWKTKTI